MDTFPNLTTTGATENITVVKKKSTFIENFYKHD